MHGCLFAYLPVIFSYYSLEAFLWPSEYGFCCVHVLEEGRKEAIPGSRVRSWGRCFHIGLAKGNLGYPVSPIHQLGNLVQTTISCISLAK